MVKITTPELNLSSSGGLPDPGSGYYLVGDVSELPPAGFNMGWLWEGLRLNRLVVRYNDPNVFAAWRREAGSGLDAYLDLSDRDPSQWAALVDQAYLDVDGEIWLDLEDAAAAMPGASTVLSQVAGMLGVTGVYTRPDIIQSLGNPQVGGYSELWLADWTVPVSCNVWFGGWTRARQVQYLGNLNVGGLLIDLSAREGA